MSETELPPMWLIDKHGSLEAALLAADLAVVNQEAETGTAHRALRDALERKQEADEEFNRASREYDASYSRLHNTRKHRDWVESMCPGGQVTTEKGNDDEAQR